MPVEPSERAKQIDVSDLPDGIASDPNWAKVREVSERGGFLDRSPAPRPTRRHLTGRNQQFNAKATGDTIRRSTPSATSNDGSPASRSSTSSPWAKRPCGSER